MSSEIMAAVVTIKQAGREIDLQDRIAQAWADERERRLKRTIGEAAALAMDLQRLLKFDRQQADEAVHQYLERGYQQVAVEATLQFAKELSTPPARSAIRPIEEDRHRRNPTDGEPPSIPLAIRRATAHAIQHRVKARAGR